MSSIADGYPRVAFETLVGDGGSDSRAKIARALMMIVQITKAMIAKLKAARAKMLPNSSSTKASTRCSMSMQPAHLLRTYRLGPLRQPRLMSTLTAAQLTACT